MSLYRCGYCGQPTNKDGKVLDIEEVKKNDYENNASEYVQGECCDPRNEDNYRVITREMAIDAGDMSLEGQMWRW